MHYLFISLDGLSTDLAWHIAQEGHEVRFHTMSPDERDVGSGFLTIVEDYESHVPWAEVIVIDDVLGMGTLAAKLRAQGKAVVGGTPYTDSLEDDRSFGHAEMVRHGIPVIPSWDFSSFDEAIAHIRAYPAAYVLKPTKVMIPTTFGFLYVGEHPQGLDVIEVLEEYRRSWAKHLSAFQLQRKVHGVEMAVGAFFNGKRFLDLVNVNFEHKKLFPGELGPETGEMGTSMFWTKKSKLFEETLRKMEKTLAHEGFAGYIDMNCIVNDRGVHPLEFTTRFGYPTISIQTESFTTPLGLFFAALARGEDLPFTVTPGFQVGVRIVVPPFPFNDEETFKVKSKGAKITVTGTKKGLHVEDVALINGDWRVAGTAGVVLIAVGLGKTMVAAQENAYELVQRVHIPRMYYRNDIGSRWTKDEPLLRTWGYLDRPYGC